MACSQQRKAIMQARANHLVPLHTRPIPINAIAERVYHSMAPIDKGTLAKQEPRPITSCRGYVGTPQGGESHEPNNTGYKPCEFPMSRQKPTAKPKVSAGVKQRQYGNLDNSKFNESIPTANRNASHYSAMSDLGMSARTTARNAKRVI